MRERHTDGIVYVPASGKWIFLVGMSVIAVVGLSSFAADGVGYQVYGLTMVALAVALSGRMMRAGLRISVRNIQVAALFTTKTIPMKEVRHFGYRKLPNGMLQWPRLMIQIHRHDGGTKTATMVNFSPRREAEVLDLIAQLNAMLPTAA